MIKRYLQKITETGDIIETIDLDALAESEKAALLVEVYKQGLARLGYIPAGPPETTDSTMVVPSER